MDHLLYLFCVFVVLWGLFIAALWSPAGKGLTSWLSFLMLNCVIVTFPCGILSQVWCLIVSIHDICPFYYFQSTVHHPKMYCVVYEAWSTDCYTAFFTHLYQSYGP